MSGGPEPPQSSTSSRTFFSTATIEESKERVERYKWVYGLVPALTEADPTRRNAALAMVRRMT